MEIVKPTPAPIVFPPVRSFVVTSFDPHENEARDTEVAAHYFKESERGSLTFFEHTEVLIEGQQAVLDRVVDSFSDWDRFREVWTPGITDLAVPARERIITAPGSKATN